MSDFTTFQLQYNSGAGTDASPVWTGSALAFGGSAGANEIRFCGSGAGGASTASASWPYVTRPSSGTAVIPEAWAFASDTVGLKIATYDATSAHYMQLRWAWDNVGTFAAAPQFSAFADSTHTAPSAGTQPPGTHNDPITNGSADTSSTSYLKINAYGYGVDTAGTQQTPGSNAAGTLAVTTGTAGSVSPGTGAWLATWQSAQGFIQYILDGATPKTVGGPSTGYWYWVMALYMGVTMTTGTLTPVITMQYSYS